MFVTEHDPVHGKLGTHELNLVNGAGLVKSQYFSSVYSPGMTIMPWVQYHIDEIQTQFMWFDGPDAERTHRKNCTIISETIPPGEEKTLVMPIIPAPPSPIEWLQVGQGKVFPYPKSKEKGGYNLAKVNAISIYVYHPRQAYTYEVSGLRTISDGPEKR